MARQMPEITLKQAYRTAIDPMARNDEGDDWWHADWGQFGDAPQGGGKRIRLAAKKETASTAELAMVQSRTHEISPRTPKEPATTHTKP